MKTTEQIWDKFSDSLMKFINSKVHNLSDSEDILQNVFIKIHNNIDKIRDHEKIVSWLYTVTRNSIIDFYRSKKIDFDISLIEKKLKSKDNKDKSNSLAFYNCILKLVDGYSDSEKDVFNLYEVEKLKHKEIAEKLDITISASKSKLKRVKDKLKRTFKTCCEYEVNEDGKYIYYGPVDSKCSNCSDDC